MTKDLTADDKTRLHAIYEAEDPDTIAALVFDYYHDADRADRTSRAQMYLHLGMLTGAVMRAVSRQPRELRIALDESVKLQSHYAALLNMHDGGRRVGFNSVDAWIARLRETGTLPKAVSKS